MGLSIGVYQTIEQAIEWQESNSLISPVLADSTEDVTSLFTVAPPWVAIIDENQIIQYTSVSYEDSTAEILISILDTLWNPEVGLAAEEIDFGQVNPGESDDFELMIENSGTGVLELVSASVDNPDFSVEITPCDIYAVDDFAFITITFTPQAQGLCEGTLTLTSIVKVKQLSP